MQREDFELLLKDLYEHFNPSKLKDVNLIPMLLAKHKDREFEAITHIFIMYNSKYNSANYNPDFGSEQHIRFLIERYSNKERAFSKEALKEIADKQRWKAQGEQQEEQLKTSAEKEKYINEVSEEVKATVKEQVGKYFETKKAEIDKMLNELLLRKSEDIAKFFEEKKKEIQKNVESIPEVVSQIIEGEKQQLIKNPEQNEQSLELINKIQEILKNNDLIEIKINLFEFEGKDLVLPNKEVMKQVSIGERLVVYDSDRKIYGLGVKDIVYDTISEKDKCIKEITFEKLN